MKKLLLSLLFITCAAQAQEYDEYLGGSLTYHIFDPNSVSQRFSNKLDSSGQLIANALFGYRHVTVDGVDYTSHVYFGGANSVAEPMFGAAWSRGIAINGLRLGVIGGVYVQDTRPFLDRGIMPPMFIPVNGWGPVPLIGIELIKSWDFTHDGYFLVNGLITPILLNASVGIGWRI